MFILYAALLLSITWPISELSITKAALLGDSFGLINALFSGLALIGVVITVLLQQREMKETRYEFKKSANAQERTAELTALSTLLDEYNNRYALNAKLVKRYEKYGYEPVPEATEEVLIQISNEQKKIICKRGQIVHRLEGAVKLNE